MSEETFDWTELSNAGAALSQMLRGAEKAHELFYAMLQGQQKFEQLQGDIANLINEKNRIKDECSQSVTQAETKSADLVKQATEDAVLIMADAQRVKEEVETKVNALKLQGKQLEKTIVGLDQQYLAKIAAMEKDFQTKVNAQTIRLQNILTKAEDAESRLATATSALDALKAKL